MLPCVDRLAAHGIELRHWREGSQRAACPHCDRGPKDAALAVTVEHDGAVWLCHRCGFKGAVRGRGESTVRPTERPQAVALATKYGAIPRTLWQEPRFAISRLELFRDLVELCDDGRLEDWMILGIATQYFTDHVAPMMEARRAAEGEGGSKPATEEIER